MKQKSIQIEQLKTFSPEDAEAIRRLAKLLGEHASLLTDENLQEMLSSSNMYLFIARDPQTHHIVGMLTQIIYRIPYAKKSYLDDIIIDENYRGMGIGSQLLGKAIQNAKTHHVVFIALTANPKRNVGIKLYEKFGFKKRDTNYYRLEL